MSFTRRTKKNNIEKNHRNLALSKKKRTLKDRRFRALVDCTCERAGDHEITSYRVRIELDVVVDFLNSTFLPDDPSADVPPLLHYKSDSEVWHFLLKPVLDSIRPAVSKEQLVEFHREAKWLHDELTETLTSIAYRDATPEEENNALDSIISKVNLLGVPFCFDVQPEPWPGTAQFSTPHGQTYRLSKSIRNDATLEQRLYGYLAMAIENDDFKQLRQCLHCDHFFLTPHGNSWTCSDECARSRDNEKAKGIRLPKFQEATFWKAGQRPGRKPQKDANAQYDAFICHIDNCGRRFKSEIWRQNHEIRDHEYVPGLPRG